MAVELELGRGLPSAWSEAATLFRLAQRTGAYEHVRRDILPDRETDAGMAAYRRCVLSFYDSFVRRNGVPAMPRFKLPKLASKPPQPKQTWQARLGQEKLTAIEDALRAGLSVLQIASKCRTSPNTIKRVRRQMEHERVREQVECVTM